ncbi:hypothetical protein D9M68_595400 [compost metagenome]
MFEGAAADEQADVRRFAVAQGELLAVDLVAQADIHRHHRPPLAAADAADPQHALHRALEGQADHAAGPGVPDLDVVLHPALLVLPDPPDVAHVHHRSLHAGIQPRLQPHVLRHQAGLFDPAPDGRLGGNGAGGGRAQQDGQQDGAR